MRVHVKRQQVILAFVLLLFFASGFSAILYQTIWQRMLGFFSGVDVYSVTITIAAFMAGLGCGNLAGGHLADRLSAGKCLLGFGIAEAVTALFALSSKWFYYDFLYGRCPSLAGSRLLLPMILFASLLVPTFCMGVTLPMLARTCTRKINAASATVGALYGVNTLGAAAGAFVTGWILFRHFGSPEILRIGAALNGLCAVAAIFLWRLGSGSETVNQASERLDTERPAAVVLFPIPVWMMIYALSGFGALSLEVVWFRILGVIQKSTSLTFATLLGFYLSGLGIGAIFGLPLARRARRPGSLFLALQSAVIVYAGGALLLFLGQVDHAKLLQPIWDHLGSYDPADVEALLSAVPDWISGTRSIADLWTAVDVPVLVFFVLPFCLIVPSTFLMGVSFPILQRLIQDNAAFLGRRVGWLQTMNIVGCMFGAIVTGWLLLRWFGAAGTLRIVTVLSAFFLVLLAWKAAKSQVVRVVGVIAAISFGASIAVALPNSNVLWAKLHGSAPEAVIVKESSSGLSVAKTAPSAAGVNTVWIFNNGLGQSWFPYGREHTQIGILASLLHPNPEEIAVIGLGSGDTLYASAGSPRTRRLTCIEILQSNYALLREVAPLLNYAPLSSLLQDARIQWLFNDGRAYIQRSHKRFDIIEADALRPHTAYSGNLYSVEYFRTAKAHLKPGGFAITWAPTDRVLSSFISVFEHGIVVGDVAIGSDAPINVDTGEISRRLSDPYTSEHYRRISPDVRFLLADLFDGRFARFSPELDHLPTRDVNSDLFPRDEYNVPEER